MSSWILSIALVCLESMPATKTKAEYEGPEREQVVEMQIELKDGSIIKGELLNHETQVTTRLGNLGWQEVEGFRIGKEKNKLELTWKNGDKLIGSYKFSALELESILGRVSVPAAVMKSGKVKLTHRAAPIRPVGVKVSGQYAHHKIEYAFDRNLGTSWSSGDWKGWIEFDLGEVYELDSLSCHLQFHPHGQATYQIYLSDVPIGTLREQATLLKSISGYRQNHDALKVNCQPKTKGRYVQVHCLSSRAWFNVRELEVFARSTEDKVTEDKSAE